MYNLYLSNIISFLLLTYLGNNLLESKEINKLRQVFVFLIIVTSLTLVDGENVNLYNTMNLTIGYFVYIFLRYKCKFSKIIIVLFSFMIFSALGEVLAANILNFFLGMNSDYSIYSSEYTIGVLLSELIVYLFLILYIKMINFSYWGDLPKYSYLITIFPITTMLLLINIKDYFYLFRKHEILVLIFICLLISNFVIVFIFLKVVSTLKIKNELELTKLEKKSIDFKYELLNSQFKANYTFMHDTIRSIMKIQSLLQKKEYDLFEKELISINKTMLRGLNIVNSNSSVISPIINFHLKEMLKHNIDFKSVIEYTDFSFLDIYEQRFIFDALVEIGMQHCATSYSETKLLILKTKLLNKQVIIQLITSHGETNNDEIMIYNRLCEIVNIHDGRIDFEIMDDNISDSLVILFNI